MNCLVLGAGGFIGGHLCKRLKAEGHTVIGFDIKQHEYFDVPDFCTHFITGDLRDPKTVDLIMGGYHRESSGHEPWDEVFSLAADMGGAQFIFTGDNDADIMHNSALINLNVAKACIKHKVGRLFYSSSACIYPAYNQTDPNNPLCTESSFLPAAPDSCYGWEKLFSEFLYDAFRRNYELQVRIARFHNVFGPQGTYTGGREKAPAAICRKVAEVPIWMKFIEDGLPDGAIDIWGDGTATRSFLYIDEAVEGIIRLMRSDCTDILNLGSDEMITINDLARMVIDISGKNLTINNIPGPIGVRGRNSDNTLIFSKLGWKPTTPLREGMVKLYEWVNGQVNKKNSN